MLLKTRGLLTKRRVILELSNYMCLIELYKDFLEWSWWSLWRLKFLRYYLVSFSCETLSMQITAGVAKISKTVQSDLMFIFDELSEFVVIFVSNLILTAVEDVVSFT